MPRPFREDGRDELRDVGVLRHGVGQGRSVGATDDDRRQQLRWRLFNEQYNTGGSIRITVSGRSGSVSISGEAGSALFSLRKM